MARGNSDRTNKVTIWFNNFQHPDKNHPKYRGKMNVEGEDFTLSLWVDLDINGVPVRMSGRITAPGEREDDSPEKSDSGEPAF